MPKLPNVSVSSELNAVLPLISWDTDHRNFIKKLIKFKMEHICEFLGVKKGMVYYLSKYITIDNEKQILEFISNNSFTRAEFIKYTNKLQKD